MQRTVSHAYTLHDEPDSFCPRVFVSVRATCVCSQEIIENTIHGTIAWQNDHVWAAFSADGKPDVAIELTGRDVVALLLLLLLPSCCCGRFVRCCSASVGSAMVPLRVWMPFVLFS